MAKQDLEDNYDKIKNCSDKIEHLINYIIYMARKDLKAFWEIRDMH